MFGARWQLFRLSGIPINVDASWLIILAMLTWSLTRLFRENLPSLEPVTSVALGLTTALAFFACLVLHELGHAISARALGMPIRGITLFLFGGVAELGGEPPSARSEFLMAIAGPAVSLVLAVAFVVGAFLGGAILPEPINQMLVFLAVINASVLIFNMIPAFPSDGGRVFRSLLWAVTGNLRKATYWASLLGQGFAWLLIVGGLYQLFRGPVLPGLWMALIGMFLNRAAQGSYQQVLLRQVLQGEPVRRFMNPQPIVVPPWVDLRRWVEDYVYRYHRKTFPVASNGHVEGFVSTQALASYPREEWEQHTVGEVMRHDLGAISIPPDADALEALKQMQRSNSSRLLVIEAGRLVGIVSLKDLVRFLHLKLELEGDGDEPREPPSPPANLDVDRAQPVL